MLNARDSKYYEEDKVQALKALKAFEGSSDRWRDHR